MIDVFIGKRRASLKDADLLGEGGEARVFRFEQWAVKVFHPCNQGDRQAQSLRRKKIEKLKAFPQGLPANVVGPLELASDSKGDIVGFVMEALQNVEPASCLLSRKYRQHHASHDVVLALFRELERTLHALHLKKVIVGDFNDGNVLVRPTSRATYFIDADSMQYGGYPCVVGHERFLDPRLYGVDLSAAPRFDEGSDWFSFAVMFFSSLLSVHPYGGVHPKLGTLLRRAEASHPITKSDVVLPRAAVSWKTLSDEALQYFVEVFERGQRASPPKSVLEQRFATCPCGEIHARSVCPSCHALGPLSARQVIRTKGRCSAKSVRSTRGRLLKAGCEGRLRYLVEEDGVLRREDGAVAVSRPLLPGERAVLAGPSTWLVGRDGALQRYENGKLLDRAQTDLRVAEPIFAASAHAAFRTEREWLIEISSGLRVGQVLEGQTWLFVGERLGLGFYRVGGQSVVFLIRVGRAGLKRIPEIQWSGRLVSAQAVFDARHALFSIVVELNGREIAQRWLISETGELLGTSLHGRLGHAALLSGRVVLATDEGLVALKAESGALVETATFPDTQPFVSAQDELLPMNDGSVVVVTPTELLQLSLW